jgi:hypothetical protein
VAGPERPRGERKAGAEKMPHWDENAQAVKRSDFHDSDGELSAVSPFLNARPYFSITPCDCTPVSTPRPARHGAAPLAGSLRALLLGSTLLSLAACGGSGEEDGGGSDYSVNVPAAPDSGGSGILGSYFVSSFAPYEALAADLRASALYAIQQVSWSFQNAPATVRNSFAPASARVEYAHAAGLTGKGQVVAIVDAGFRASHEAFADNVISKPNGLPVDSHGTAVASVVAGFSPTMVGIAPNASLALGSYDSIATLAAATSTARNLGAVAQNNSWGFVDNSGATLTVSDTNFATIFGTGNAYSAALTNYAAEGVVVFALSNDATDTSAGLMEALPALLPGLEAGWLAVGNAVPDFDADGINAAELVSSACLEAAAWCLLADGTWTAASAVSDTSYDFGVGSSFAAPQVSGALALLAEAFPALSAHDLRLRLLASADNGFFTPTDWLEIENGLKHGYDATYGHGFLDIRAALLPIGTPKVTLADGAVTVLSTPPIVSGTAFGDAVTRSLSAVDVSVTDSLNAEFRAPGAVLAATAGLPDLGTGRLARAFSAGLAERRVASTAPLSDRFDGFAGRTAGARLPDGSLSAAVLLPQGGDGYGISLSTALQEGSTRLDLGLKLARDGGTLLGLGEDAGGNDLFAVELALSQELAGNGFLALTGEIGIADLSGADILGGVSAAGFNSFGVEIGRHDLATRGDRLAFGAALPMAVTSGRAETLLPVARGIGATSYEPFAIDLAPEARQVDLSISYQRPLGERAELLVELVHAENLGNRAGAQDTAAVLAFGWSF